VAALDVLPLTPSGKVNRRALPPPPTRSEVSHGFVEPHTSAERVLADIWAELLHINRVGANDNFFELGGESILAVQMAARARGRGLSLTPKDLFQHQTVAELAALAGVITSDQSAPPHRLLVPMRTGGHGPPLFCIHPIEGTVYGYAAMVRLLDTDQPIYGIRAAGLEPGETPAIRVRAMAAEYVEAIRAVQRHGPYFLCGWSMGGLIAYEMARLLRSDEDPVAFLALLDQGPSATLLTKSPEAARLVERFGRTPEDLGSVTDEQLLQLRTEPAVAQLLPPELDDEAAVRHLRVYLRNWQTLGDYNASPSPEHIHLLRAETQEMGDVDETLGWAGVARGGVAVHRIPGDHHTMMRFPHVPDLARALHECLLPILQQAGEKIAV
jgi:thioesterase domain-containing protein